MVIRVPFTGGEKESLHTSMQRCRSAVRWKVEGLDDEQLRRPMVPSGTSVLGLVKHLAAVEYSWFCKTFGRETEPLPFDDDDPDVDLRIEAHESTADVLAFYERACAAADAVIDELDVEAVGRAWWGEPVSLRWVLIHMIEETARHAGHVDIARELLDGVVGTSRKTDRRVPAPPARGSPGSRCRGPGSVRLQPRPALSARGRLVASTEPTRISANAMIVDAVTASSSTSAPAATATAGLTYATTTARAGPTSEISEKNNASPSAVHRAARPSNDHNAELEGIDDGQFSAAIGAYTTAVRARQTVVSTRPGTACRKREAMIGATA